MTPDLHMAIPNPGPVFLTTFFLDASFVTSSHFFRSCALACARPRTENLS